MKTYSNFNEMFNAQSGVKQDMSVFNDLSGLEAVAERNGFELILERRDDTYARYGLHAKNFEPVRRALYILKGAREYNPSFFALNTDLKPLTEEYLGSYLDTFVFPTVAFNYYPDDENMDIWFNDLNGQYIKDRGGDYNNWHMHDVASLDEGIAQLYPSQYEDVIPVWEAQMQEFNRRAQDTLKLAERYQNYSNDCDRNPLGGEVVAAGSFPSEYVGQIDVDSNQQYGKLNIID